MKRYATNTQRLRCCVGVLLMPLALPAFLLWELLRGLWECATYLRGHLAWRWRDELLGGWWVLACALSGRNLAQEWVDRQDAEFRESVLDSLPKGHLRRKSDEVHGARRKTDRRPEDTK